MKKKMMRAIKDLNAYIDDDRQKLCDELHEIKLSHKRLERLLRQCVSYLDDLPAGVYRDVLVYRIRQELSYPYFRVNYKLKGGKNA